MAACVQVLGVLEKHLAILFQLLILGVQLLSGDARQALLLGDGKGLGRRNGRDSVRGLIVELLVLIHLLVVMVQCNFTGLTSDFLLYLYSLFEFLT